MHRRILRVPNMETIVYFLTRILEYLFFIGMAGSALVVMWTTVEDFEVFFEEDELPPTGKGPVTPADASAGIRKTGIHTAVKP